MDRIPLSDETAGIDDDLDLDLIDDNYEELDFEHHEEREYDIEYDEYEIVDDSELDDIEDVDDEYIEEFEEDED